MKRLRLVLLLILVVISASGTPRAQTPVPGLVAAYSFDEASGPTANDGSGNNLTGAIANATWTTAGKYGSALAFNGSSSWVTVPDAASLDLTTGMTLEAWVLPTALGAGVWRNVIIKERAAGEIYNLYANADTNAPVVFAVPSSSGNPVDARATAGLPLNTWTHLAATYNNSTLRLYVNGTLAGSRTLSGALLTSTGVLRIGGNSLWGEFFQGSIDEVRIYNRALSATEIQVDMGNAIGSGALNTLLTGTPSEPSNSTSGTFTFTSTVAGSSFACQLDGAAFVSCTSPQTYSNLGPGRHSFQVQATDGAGNIDATPASYAWTIDTTPPVVSITSPTSSPTYTTGTSPLSLAGTASDPNGVAQVTWTNGRGGNGTASGGTSWTATGIALQSGVNVLTVSGRDGAGNIGTATLTVTYTGTVPDTTPPDTSITAAPPNPSANSTATFSFVSTESGSNFQCQLDGSAYASCTSPRTYSSLASGSHTFRVRAVDLAGNMDPTPAAHTWTYSPVTRFPTGTVIDTGTLRGGAASRLNADDNNYYQVDSTTTSTRVTSWYGVFSNVSTALANLKVTYKGKNSQSCAQTVAIWRWSDGTWVQIDSRNVGNSEVSIANIVPTGTPSAYVSGSGEVRVQVRCTRTGNFFSSGDLMWIVHDVP